MLQKALANPAADFRAGQWERQGKVAGRPALKRTNKLAAARLAKSNRYVNY